MEMPPDRELSEHLVDPEIIAFARQASLGVLSKATIAEVRARMIERVGAGLSRQRERGVGASVELSERLIPSADGERHIRALLYLPLEEHSGRRPAYLHLHGGGLVMGSPEMMQQRNYLLAANHGCVIVSPAYRLAPESRYPAAIEDCYSALQWLHRHAGDLGIDANKIIVGGESGGGGLAAALCLLARDRKEIDLAGQFLIYPMLDSRTGSRESAANRFAGEFVWTRELNRFAWESVLGPDCASADPPPYASAGRAANLSELPPTFIAVGSLDLFVDENLNYAQRLINAGVLVNLRVYPGAPHAFDLAGDTIVGRQFIRDCDAALSELFNPRWPGISHPSV